MKGLTLFERDETGVHPAVIHLGSIFQSFNGATGETESTTTRYVKKKEGAEYIWALNQRNAERKFLKK